MQTESKLQVVWKRKNDLIIWIIMTISNTPHDSDD